MKQKKHEKNMRASTGITLVALVITIIILIILATVGISMLFGEGGILDITENARETTQIENVREKLEVAKGMAAIDGNGHIDPDHFFNILEEEGIIWDKEEDVEEKGDGIYNVTTKEGYVFEIILGEDGDITIDYVGKENVIGPRIREIKVLETSSNSVRIEVVADNVEGATYTYSAKQEPIGEWEEKGTSSENIYTIEGLTSETAYTIRVVVETNKGSAEEEIGVTIGELPTGIITFGNTTWSNERASVTISTESSYTLQYQINGIDEGSWTEISNGSAVTGLELGQTLYARLWDGTNGGEHASVDIEDKTAPNVTVTRGNVTSNSIGVSVIANDNESGMASSLTYTYYIKQTSQPDSSYTAEATDVTSSSYTFSGLTQGVSYDIRVEVKADKANNTGAGTLLNVTTGTVTSGLEEGAITFGDTTWSNGQASVTVNTNTSYTIQYQINGIDEGNWTEIPNGSAVTGLEWQDTLYARLWDGTNGGEHASVDIEDKTAPVVTVNRGTVTSNSIGVNVTANDNESGMASNLTYTYYIKQTSQSDSSYTARATDSTSSSYTFSGLTQGTSYDIKVEVKADKAGNTGTNTLLNTTTGTVTGGLEEGAITFGNTTWSNEQASVTVSTNTNYAIQYQINGIAEGNWTEISNGGTVTGLELGQTLYARLWDGTNGGEHASIDIEDKTAPNVSIETNNLTYNSVTLTVTASDNESGLAETNRYTYYLDNVQQASNNTASYTYTGLNAETEYELKVIVKNKAGLSTEQEITIATIEDSNRIDRILKEGDYVNYVDASGTTRTCVVLYGPENANYSKYGIQIVTMQTTESVKLDNGNGVGTSSETTNVENFEIAMNAYNNLVSTLNNKSSKYLNDVYASSARSVGCDPANPTADTETYFYGITFSSEYNGKFKNADNNYLIDLSQMEKLGIAQIYQSYFLASRCIITGSDFVFRAYYCNSTYQPGSSSICWVYNTGRIRSGGRAFGLRPVFTLKTNVRVTGGTGDLENPYTLGTQNG